MKQQFDTEYKICCTVTQTVIYKKSTTEVSVIQFNPFTPSNANLLKFEYISQPSE